MHPLTHLDGSDVVVIDSRGRHVPAVDEVRVEPGFAVVSLTAGARNWVRDLLSTAREEDLACEILSTDGRLHHRGAVRIVCA